MLKKYEFQNKDGFVFETVTHSLEDAIRSFNRRHIAPDFDEIVFEFKNSAVISNGTVHVAVTWTELSTLRQSIVLSTVPVTSLREFVHKHGRTGWLRALELFIEKAPEFDGDLELAKRIGTVTSDLESVIATVPCLSNPEKNEG